MASLEYIRGLVARLADQVKCPERYLPTYGSSEDGARPHIEVNADGIHYVVVERGQELRRNTSRALDDVLYWIFADISFNLACDYEVNHRRDGEDFRRQLFQYQGALLDQLNPEWAIRHNLEIRDILVANPFVDGPLGEQPG